MYDTLCSCLFSVLSYPDQGATSLHTMPSLGMLTEKAGSELPPVTESKEYSAAKVPSFLFYVGILLPSFALLSAILVNLANGSNNYPFMFVFMGQPLSLIGMVLSMVAKVTRTKDTIILTQFGGSIQNVPLTGIRSIEITTRCGLRKLRINYTDEYHAALKVDAGCCATCVGDYTEVCLDHLSEFAEDHRLMTGVHLQQHSGASSPV